jgi:DNA-binding CsgD family transcriptional regulator
MNMSVSGKDFQKSMVTSDGQAASSSLSKAEPHDSAAPQNPANAATKICLLGSLLTDKQCQVLDLLIQHKTSKEIARALGISSHTVDQRIMLSRTKLGLASRSEVAQAYRRLLTADGLNGAAQSASPVAKSVCDQSVYGFSYVASHAFVPETRGREDVVTSVQTSPPIWFALPEALRLGEAGRAEYHHVLPEKFDGPYGTFLRLGAIGLIAVFLILIIMGGLAMFAQLSQILDR